MTQPTPGRIADAARAAIRDVPDFPKPGITFKDITPVLGDVSLFRDVTAALAAPYRGRGVTHVVGIESRGFILAGPVAQVLDAGFVPVRKPGKLPWRSIREAYALEYGTDALEIHQDALGSGASVLVIDDVLATGGTAGAACRLVERAGGLVVACAFMIELTVLGGRGRLGGHQISSLVTY